MKISVICVTNRLGAVKFWNEQLEKQTFKDFQVIIADDNAQFNVFDDKLTYFLPRKKNTDDVWNLNKAYNDCLDLATGELLVFLQDFIWIPANGLQRFWDLYEIYPDALITGCGHKYEKDLKTIVEIDDRALGDKKVVPCHWSQWEMNWSSCPAKLMPKFDEEMDKHFGGENQYIAKTAGKQVYLDRLNECKGWSQELCGGRPEKWEELHFNKTNKYREFLN